MSNPLYTVQRCTLNSNKFYGPIHFSEDGDSTICGLEIDKKWFILTNRNDGQATCKKCKIKLTLIIEKEEERCLQ